MSGWERIPQWSVFDGIRLEHYMVEGSNENLKRVFVLVEMPGNELWVGTGMGLFRLADDGRGSSSGWLLK